MFFPNAAATDLAARCVTAFQLHFLRLLLVFPQGVKRQLKSSVSTLPGFPVCESLCRAVQRKTFNVTIKAFLLRLNDQEVRHKPNKKFQKLSHQ